MMPNVRMAMVSVLPMLLLLAWAAVEDIRTRRIRNWLNLTLALGGILNSYINPGSLVTPGQSWMGLGLGFGLLFVLYALRAVGAGDVKLMSAIGAWVGPVGVIEVFVLEKLIGLAIVLVQCTWQGRLFDLFRNSAVLAINLAHVNTLGIKHVSETGKEFRSIDRPLPYALPVMMATIIVIIMGPLRWG